MIEFSQPELLNAVKKYEKQETKLLADAEAFSVQWRYANDEMFGLFPLFDQIGFRGSSMWQPAKRRWLKDATGYWHKHGFDEQGRVRLIRRYDDLNTLFVYFDQWVDEVVFGGRGTSLRRYVRKNGRTIAEYDYQQDPHQYSLEIFEYDDNRCVGSVAHSWFVSDGNWIAATWTTKCVFEYDAEGLVKVFRNRGKFLGGNTLVYVRPKPKSTAKDKKTSRRPFVGYTMALPAGAEPEYAVYTDAYGLEMTIDDEWPIDTVILTPPELVYVVTEQIDVTSMGTVFAGASSAPPDGKLAKVKGDGGKWLLLDARESDVSAHVSSALKVKLNLILSVSNPEQISHAVKDAGKLNAKQLVVAFRPQRELPPEKAQELAAEMRSELRTLGCEKSRVVVAQKLDKSNVMEYVNQPDIDGVLLYESSFGEVLAVLGLIAMHR